jgi:hypothetical protein
MAINDTKFSPNQDLTQGAISGFNMTEQKIIAACNGQRTLADIVRVVRQTNKVISVEKVRFTLGRAYQKGLIS